MMGRRSLSSRIERQGVRLAGSGITVRRQTGAQVQDSVLTPSGAPRIRKPALNSTEPATRVLGLDLAASTTGYAALVGGEPVAHGAFTLPDRARNESLAHWMERRASELALHVTLLVSEHRPEVVGFETPDGYRKAWSGGTKGREFVVALALGRAQGALAALWPSIGAGARLVAVPTGEAKRLAAGRPDASKDQVAYGLRTYRGFDLRGWDADAVDALAVALAARESIG